MGGRSECVIVIQALEGERRWSVVRQTYEWHGASVELFTGGEGSYALFPAWVCPWGGSLGVMASISDEVVHKPLSFTYWGWRQDVG